MSREQLESDWVLITTTQRFNLFVDWIVEDTQHDSYPAPTVQLYEPPSAGDPLVRFYREKAKVDVDVSNALFVEPTFESAIEIGQLIITTVLRVFYEEGLIAARKREAEYWKPFDKELDKYKKELFKDKAGAAKAYADYLKSLYWDKSS